MVIVPRTTFIYALIDPRDGAFRYVGKANDPDVRLRNHVKEARKGGKDHKCRWVASVLREGGYPRLRILEECQHSEWKEREQYWIWLFRGYGCRLTNAKDGGDGIEPDEATRAKMSAAKKGKPAHNKGGTTSEEARAKQSAAANRRWARTTEDERRAYAKSSSDTRKANHRPLSEETRARMSASAKRRVYTPEENARNSARQLLLTYDQVAQVRQMIAAGKTLKSIAMLFNCSATVISNIKTGKSYKSHD